MYNTNAEAGPASNTMTYSFPSVLKGKSVPHFMNINQDQPSLGSTEKRSAPAVPLQASLHSVKFRKLYVSSRDRVPHHILSHTFKKGEALEFSGHRLDSHSRCVNRLTWHHSGQVLASVSDDLKAILWRCPLFSECLYSPSLADIRKKQKNEIERRLDMDLNAFGSIFDYRRNVPPSDDHLSSEASDIELMASRTTLNYGRSSVNYRQTSSSVPFSPSGNNKVLSGSAVLHSSQYMPRDSLVSGGDPGTSRFLDHDSVTSSIEEDGSFCNDRVILSPGHVANILGVGFLPTNPFATNFNVNDNLVTAGLDYHVNITSIRNNQQISSYNCHNVPIKTVETSPDNPFIFWSVGDDGAIREFDTRENHVCSNGTGCKNCILASFGTGSSISPQLAITVRDLRSLHQLAYNHLNRHTNPFLVSRNCRLGLYDRLNDAFVNSPYYHLDLDATADARAATSESVHMAALSCQECFWAHRASVSFSVNPVRSEYMLLGWDSPVIEVYDRRMLSRGSHSDMWTKLWRLPVECRCPYNITSFPQGDDRGSCILGMEPSVTRKVYPTHVQWSRDGKEFLTSYSNENVYSFTFSPSRCEGIFSKYIAPPARFSSPEKATHRISERNTEQVKFLEAQGNEKFGQEDYCEAVDCYTAALEKSGPHLFEVLRDLDPTVRNEVFCAPNLPPWWQMRDNIRHRWLADCSPGTMNKLKKKAELIGFLSSLASSEVQPLTGEMQKVRRVFWNSKLLDHVRRTRARLLCCRSLALIKRKFTGDLNVALGDSLEAIGWAPTCPKPYYRLMQTICLKKEPMLSARLGAYLCEMFPSNNSFKEIVSHFIGLLENWHPPGHEQPLAYFSFRDHRKTSESHFSSSDTQQPESSSEESSSASSSSSSSSSTSFSAGDVECVRPSQRHARRSHRSTRIIIGDQWDIGPISIVCQSHDDNDDSDSSGSDRARSPANSRFEYDIADDNKAELSDEVNWQHYREIPTTSSIKSSSTTGTTSSSSSSSTGTTISSALVASVSPQHDEQLFDEIRKQTAINTPLGSSSANQSTDDEDDPVDCDAAGSSTRALTKSTSAKQTEHQLECAVRFLARNEKFPSALINKSLDEQCPLLRRILLCSTDAGKKFYQRMLQRDGCQTIAEKLSLTGSLAEAVVQGCRNSWGIAIASHNATVKGMSFSTHPAVRNPVTRLRVRTSASCKYFNFVDSLGWRGLPASKSSFKGTQPNKSNPDDSENSHQTSSTPLDPQENDLARAIERYLQCDDPECVLDEELLSPPQDPSPKRTSFPQKFPSETTEDSNKEKQAQEEPSSTVSYYDEFHQLPSYFARNAFEKPPAMEDIGNSWEILGNCRRFAGHSNRITEISEAAFWGEDLVVGASDMGFIFIWRKHDGSLAKILHGHVGSVNCVQPHPHLAILASSGLDHYIQLWRPYGDWEKC